MVERFMHFLPTLATVIRLENQSLYVCYWSLFEINNSFSRFSIAKLIFLWHLQMDQTE